MREGFNVCVWPKRNLEEKKGKVQQVAKLQHMMVTFGDSPSGDRDLLQIGVVLFV
jgi:hypothetical protein